MFNKLSVLMTFFIVLIVSLVMIGFGFYTVITDSNTLNKELQKKLKIVTERTNNNVTLPLWNFDVESTAEVVAHELSDKDVVGILIFDNKDELFVGKVNVNNDIFDYSADLHKEQLSKAKYRAVQNVIYKKDVIGRVETFITDRRVITEINQQIIEVIIQTLVVLILTIGILYIILKKTIVKPINTIVEDVKTIGEGDFDHKIEGIKLDELHILEENINKMTERLKVAFEKEKETQKLAQEMELARHIQTSLLPKDITHDEFEIADSMLTADEVGGDFYDLTYDKKGNFWVGIGDVSGHGVTPGLIMMMSQIVFLTFHKVAYKSDITPSRIIITVNRVLYEDVKKRLGEDHFMTLTIFKYLENGEFLFAGRHLTIIIWRKERQKCELIETPGTFVNFIPDVMKVTVDNRLILDSGDILVLYTDGITEAKNSEGKILDLSGFIEIVEKHTNKDNVQKMKDAILTDVLEYCNNKRADDMSLVIVKRK